MDQSAALVSKARLEPQANKDPVVPRETRATVAFVDLKACAARRVFLVLGVLVATRATKESVEPSASLVPVVFPVCKENLEILVLWDLADPVDNPVNKAFPGQVVSVDPEEKPAPLAPRAPVALLVNKVRLASLARRVPPAQMVLVVHKV